VSFRRFFLKNWGLQLGLFKAGTLVFALFVGGEGRWIPLGVSFGLTAIVIAGARVYWTRHIRES
jgi:hypothetical protein